MPDKSYTYAIYAMRFWLLLFDQGKVECCPYRTILSSWDLFLPSQSLMFAAVPDLTLHSLSGKNLLEYINRPPTAKLQMTLDSLSLDPENADGRGTLGLAYDTVVPPWANDFLSPDLSFPVCSRWMCTLKHW